MLGRGELVVGLMVVGLIVGGLVVAGLLVLGFVVVGRGVCALVDVVVRGFDVVGLKVLGVRGAVVDVVCVGVGDVLAEAVVWVAGSDAEV